MKIQGKGEVMWTEQRSHSSDSNNTTMQNVTSNIIQDPSSTDTYSSEESYFENKFNLLGGGNFKIVLYAKTLFFSKFCVFKIFLKKI